MLARYRLEPRHARDGIEFQIFPERPFVGEARAAVAGKPGRGERRLLQ